MLWFSAILLSQCGCSMSPAVIKINTMCKATAQDCARQLFDPAAVPGQMAAIIQAMNAHTAIRHQNDRHSVSRQGMEIADYCS